jgi:hypothetical protein
MDVSSFHIEHPPVEFPLFTKTQSILPKLKCAIPKTPMSVARSVLGARTAQYVAAAIHIR